MSVRSSKSQVGCAAALTSISTASAHQGFPDSPRVLPFLLFPVSFPNQSYRTCVSQVLQNHLSCSPESWDCLLPHGSIIPMSLARLWAKKPQFVSSCVSPAAVQASLTQVISNPQVFYLLSTQHPLLWDWLPKVNFFSNHKHLQQCNNQHEHQITSVIYYF